MPRINHLDTAQMVVNRFVRGNIIFSDSFFWKWDRKGVWVKISDWEVKKVIHELHRNNESLSKNVIGSIVDMVKTETYTKINLSNHSFHEGHYSINCLNGELNWTGESFELVPHTRERYCITQVPILFDPSATAPRFTQFLYEIFQDDPEIDSKVILALELTGYTLLSSCGLEKFVLLLGSGANGKSVLMETVSNLLGRENVSAVQPSQFANRFQVAHLHGKLANMITEIAEGHTIDDAQLKAIVSGELMTAEHKLKPPFEFRPFCTCWFATNHMPRTKDFSDALFRRAVILTFHRRFSEEEQDKQLKGKLNTELQGIFTLAVAAISEVLKRNYFTKVASAEIAKEEWRKETDQAAHFAADCLVKTLEGRERSADIYAAYQIWTRFSELKPSLNQNQLTQRLRRLGMLEPEKGTAGARMLAGARLKDGCKKWPMPVGGTGGTGGGET
jgi:putative DNA primase/helicase